MSDPKEWLISKRDGKYLVDPRSHDDREGSTHRVIDWEIYDQVCRERDEMQKLVDTYFQEQLELHDEVVSLQVYRDWAIEAWETLDSYVHCHLKPDEIEDDARELLAKFPSPEWQDGDNG